MHILIVNTVMLNGGDAAILQAMVGLLRDRYGPDTTFTIHESQPGVARRYYPEYDMQPRAYRVVARHTDANGVRQRAARRAHLARFRLACDLWARGLGAVARTMLTSAERKLVREFLAADLVVTTGGTYLVEHYDFTSRLFALETARRLGRPVVFYTQSLGPFTRPDRRRDVAREVNAAALVLLRDDRSLGHLRDLGVREDHLHVTADVVFAIADEAALATARTAGPWPTPRPDGAGPRVAMSVRSWAHFKSMTAEAGMDAYREAMRAAVTHLVERYGARVTFLSTCQGVREYFTDDSRTAIEIRDMLPPHVRESVEIDRDFHTPADLAARLREYDLVVTTRMHMCILALGVGTLVFPVAYEFKTSELFKRLGLGDYVHDMEGVEADAFVRTLQSFLDDAPRIRDVMFAGVERERRRALESAALLPAPDGAAPGRARAAAPRMATA